MAVARDARKEAFERLGGRYEVRVLESSPQASAVAGVAEDPVGRGEVPEGRTLVSPVATGDVTWAELAAGDEELARWCSERWLAAWPRLGEPPAGFAQTRDALHLVAEHVMSPTRARDLGETTLRWTLGGFGTPFFGRCSQLRIEGDELVLQNDQHIDAGALTTLADAAEFVGFDLTRFEGLSGEPLEIDPGASRYLASLYGFAFSVLEELRARSSALDPSQVHLWPGHFDVAVEIGFEAAGARAAFGVSPGDERHPAPYLYVGPWKARPVGEQWNARGFAGAELPLAELLKADDQRALALDFFTARRDELNAPS